MAERALVARINRKLADESRVLRRCRRNSRWYDELGDYYMLNVRTNLIEAKRVSLEKWGREMAVLKPYEVLSGD